MLNGAFLNSLSILRFCYNNQIQTNIKDQDKMLQYVAFYQGLHYLLRSNILIIVSNQTSYYYFLISFGCKLVVHETGINRNA